jgi:lipopolysaccharide heptosyltransferase II
MSAERWKKVRNVLAVRLDSLGDVLMTTPALRALKALPGRPRITLLTSPAGAALARLIPEVDDAIPYSAPWMKVPDAHPGREDRALAAELARRRFDAAAVFTVYSQSPWPAAFLCHLAEIPLRLAHGRENPYHLLTDWAPECEPEQQVRHEVERQLDLVRSIGAETRRDSLSLRVPRGAELRAVARLVRAGIDPSARWVLLHPGASAASRRYPTEHFASAARRLEELDVPVIVVGGAEDAPFVEAIASSRLRRIQGLPLDEFAALVAQAPVLLCNNSGPAHIAAAVQTPVVVTYALTNPQHTPWKVRSRVLFHEVECAFCYKSVCPKGHHACLREVPPGDVVRAALELLGAPELDEKPDVRLR